MASKNSKQTTKKIIQMEKALNLRIKGYSYLAIAKEIGCSKATAFNYVSESLREAAEARKETADMALTMQLQQVDGVIRGLQPLCFATDDEVSVDEETGEIIPFSPNQKALGELIKYLDHKSKLLGLYVKPEEVRDKEPLPWNDDD